MYVSIIIAQTDVINFSKFRRVQCSMNAVQYDNCAIERWCNNKNDLEKDN